MTESEIILVAICAALFTLAMVFSIELSSHRDQVRKLQLQRRTERELRDKGMTMYPVVVGLWPDLDAKQRLKDENDRLKASLACMHDKQRKREPS